MRRSLLLLVLSAVALLGACAATPPPVTVQVFTAPPQLAAGATYRFERLPSQAAQPDAAALEAVADAALAGAGLRRDDAAPRLAVQLALREERMPRGWGGPGLGVGISGGSGGGGVGIGLSFPIGGGAAPATRMLDVQLRDLGSDRVVFQSQARSSAAVPPAALVEAALRGFPHAPAGVWQVPPSAPPPLR